MSIAHLLALAMVVASPTADGLLTDDQGTVAGGLEPLHHTRTDWDPDRIVFTFRTHEGAAVTMGLTRRAADGDAARHTERYDVALQVDPPARAAGLEGAIEAVLARISSREAEGPDLRRPRPPPAGAEEDGWVPGDRGRGTGSSFRAVPAGEWTGPLELGTCWLLLALSLGLLPLLCRRMWGNLVAPDTRCCYLTGAQWILACGSAVALIQLLGVPQLLVTVFSGYASVSEAHALRPVLKYGAATTALYGPLLRLFGPTTQVVIATNLALGLLTVPLVAGLAARLAGQRRAGLLALLLVGLLPALLRDRASESVLVPMGFWLAASLVHLDAWLERPRAGHLVGAIAHGALALHARPEAWIVLPLLGAAMVALETRGACLRSRMRPVAFAGAAALALVAPRLWSLAHYMASASTHGDVPGLAGAEGLAGLLDRFTHLNALWTPSIHPVTVTALALGAVLVAGAGRRLACLLALVAILAWQALSTLDLPPVSVPRVQAPAMVWAAMLAAVALSWAFGLAGRLPPVLVAAVLVLALVPAPLTLATLWAPTNAQAFDAWWQRARESLPETTATRCVVTLSMSDAPRDIVLRHYPLADIAARSRGMEHLSLETFLEAPGVILDGHCEPLYLLGPQCYARFFGFDAPPPERAEPLGVCAKIQGMFHLDPLHVEDVQNQGNADFPFYGLSPSLRYGLYRIQGPASPPPP